MLENLSRLQIRACDELFGDWTNVFGVLPMGPNDREVAQVLSKHGNWQLRNQIPNFRRQFGHRGLLMYFTTGDITAHSYFDFERDRNAHDVLTCDEFVAPYVYVTTQPDYSDLPYYFKVLRLYRHQLQKYRGKWDHIDDVLKKEAPSWEDEPESRLRETVASLQGATAPDSQDVAPYKLIWMEGFVKLPNQVDDRFVKFIFDYSTKQVLFLTIHEEADWQDKIRFEQQSSELGAYRQAEQIFAQVPQAQAAEQHMVDQIAQGQHEGMDSEKLAELQKQLMDIHQNPLPTEPPVPPGWMKNPADPMEEPERPKKRPIHMFSHGVCIEPLVGNLGLSPGRIQADINRNQNIALSQYSDAASIANSWSIITSGGLTFEEDFAIFPGKVNVAQGVSGQELRNNIYELKPGAASEQLVNLIKMQWEWGASSIQSPSILSGEPGKSGETFRGVSARIEQATKQLSGMTRKYADEFFVQVLKNNAKLNALFLPEEELIYINDDLAPPDPMKPPLKISRKMYERNYQVEISADLRFSTQSAKVQEADELMALPQHMPEVDQMPGSLLGFRWKAMSEALSARGRPDLIPYLGPDPGPPPTPFGIMGPPPGLGGPPAGPAGSPPQKKPEPKPE
jgi:hypothetical protein